MRDLWSDTNIITPGKEKSLAINILHLKILEMSHLLFVDVEYQQYVASESLSKNTI